MNQQRFHYDNDRSRETSERFLSQWYRARTRGNYRRIEDNGPLARWLQRDLDCDVIASLHPERKLVAIEEKIRFEYWPDFLLEVLSCSNPGNKTYGWMRKSRADWLLYGLLKDQDTLECHLFDFHPLRAWFWDQVKTFGIRSLASSRRWKRRMTQQSNHTVSYAVPAEEVEQFRLDQFDLKPED